MNTNTIDFSKDYDYYDKLSPIAILNLSLLTANGNATGYGTGINWGIRSNGANRNRNQAYIAYNKKDKIPGFFPDKLSVYDKNFPTFIVIIKELGFIHMRLAQANGKAIETVEDNSILGKWIRDKIGAESGEFITKEMLENYGKTFITFRKYENNIYLLDF